MVDLIELEIKNVFNTSLILIHHQLSLSSTQTPLHLGQILLKSALSFLALSVLLTLKTSRFPSASVAGLVVSSTALPLLLRPIARLSSLGMLPKSRTTTSMVLISIGNTQGRFSFES